MSWWDKAVDFGNALYSGIQKAGQWVQEQRDKKKEEEQEVEYTPTTTTPTTDSGFTYKDFQMSDTTNDFLNAYNNWKAQGAPVYADSYQGTLNGIMNDIINGKPFSWDMNGDAMYQQYKDMYTNQANLGMQNAMAQAAALTGGYGSSYGQAVGQQAYAQQMQGLNDRALDLHDRAYGQYQDQRADLYNQYGMYSDLANQEYNEWLNAINLYNQEGDKLYGQYMDSYNNDLNTYNTDKGIAYDEYTRAQDNARADEEWEKMYGENGYYTKKDQKELDNAEAERLANRKNRAETGDGSSGETNATRQAVSRIDSELRRNNVSMDTPEGKAAIENEIASLLRNERISEAEANYLIYYYGLDE